MLFSLTKKINLEGVANIRQDDVFNHLVNGKTQMETAKLLGVTRHCINIYAIQLERNGLIRCLTRKKKPKRYLPTAISCNFKGSNPVTKFTTLRNRLSSPRNYRWTHTQKERMFGELLGDGYITKDCRFGLTSTRLNHVLYLKNKLPPKLFGDETPYERPSYHKNWKKSWQILSRKNELFHNLRKKWYPSGFKVVPDDLYLTPTMCYHWYIGDGCLNKKHITIATDCFLRTDVEFLVSQLCDNGITAKMRLDKCRGAIYPRIVIPQAQLFLNWIGENEINDYDYKWRIH